MVNDVSGKSNLGYGGNTETRYFTTTNMHYLAFNMESPFVSYQQFRYALSLAVDREYAADSLMNGGAVAAALPVSPRSPLYDSTRAAWRSWACRRGTSPSPASAPCAAMKNTGRTGMSAAERAAASAA